MLIWISANKCYIDKFPFQKLFFLSSIRIRWLLSPLLSPSFKPDTRSQTQTPPDTATADQSLVEEIKISVYLMTAAPLLPFSESKDYVYSKQIQKKRFQLFYLCKKNKGTDSDEDSLV